MSFTEHPQKYTAYQWEKPLAPLVKTEKTWHDPEEGEVVVKVLACGICGTDGGLHTGHLLPISFPHVPGHEVIGDVVAVHSSVKDYKVGDRVGAPMQRAYCNECRYCKAGQKMGCEKLMMLTTGCFYEGGIAQFLRVPISGLCQVPRDMDPAEAAPLMCAGVTIYKGLEYANIRPGGTVAIHGIGGLGHLGIQYAKAMGFKTVAISSSGSKKDMSLKLGADIYIDESTQDTVAELQKLGGADAIATTAPNTEAMLKLIGGLAFEGKLLVLSLPLQPAPFMPVMLPSKRLHILGYYTGTAEECYDTVQFSKKHNIKALIETFPLSKSEEAFQRLPKAQFRAVILPWQ